MSLKAFHLVFVTLTTLISLLVSGWGCYQHFVVEERELFGSGMGTGAMMAAGGLLVAVALLCYGRYVLKKLRHIDYL